MPFTNKFKLILFFILTLGCSSLAQEIRSFKIPINKYDYSKIISVTDSIIYFITSSKQSSKIFTNRFFRFNKINGELENLLSLAGSFNCLTDNNLIIKDSAFFSDYYESGSGSTKRLSFLHFNPFKKKSAIKKEIVFEEKDISKKGKGKTVWLKAQKGFYNQSVIFLCKVTNQEKTLSEIKYRTFFLNGLMSEPRSIKLPYNNSQFRVSEVFYDDKLSNLYLLLRVSINDGNQNTEYYSLVFHNLSSNLTAEKKLDLSARKLKPFFILRDAKLYSLFFPLERKTTITDSLHLLVFNGYSFEMEQQRKMGLPSKVADELLNDMGTLFFKCVSFCDSKNKMYFVFENGTDFTGSHSSDFDASNLMRYGNYPAVGIGGGSIAFFSSAPAWNFNNVSTSDASVIIEVDTSLNIRIKSFLKFSEQRNELQTHLSSMNGEMIFLANIREKERFDKRTFPIWDITTDSLILTKSKFLTSKKMSEIKFFGSSAFESGNSIYFLGKAKGFEYGNKYANYIFELKDN